MKSFDYSNRRTVVLRQFLILLLWVIAVPSLGTNTNFDEYKVRIDGFWFYSNPTGSFQDATTGNVISLHKDFGFGSYSTFAGKLDFPSSRLSFRRPCHRLSPRPVLGAQPGRRPRRT